jgi:ribosomal protein S8
MKLTREEWINIPDSRSKMEVLVSLRKKGYKPDYAMKAQELFPEGYSVPLSEIEKRVFEVMINVMSSEGELNSWNKQILAEHMHDVSADDAIRILKEEAETRNINGNFWYTRHNIGGYELNRLIAKEIEDRVASELKRDEIKMHALSDMSKTLEGFGISMLEQDHTELERLRDEYEERQDANREYWKAERERGYQSLKPL